MNAWLLTWEGTSGPALDTDKKIVAIISARRNLRAIAMMVDLLYCRSVNTAYRMALFANKKKYRESQYMLVDSTPNRFLYGHNPYIFARVVFNLKIERDEARQLEHIRWTEPPYLHIENQGEMPNEVTPAKEMELVRAFEPLSLDIYNITTKGIHLPRAGL